MNSNDKGAVAELEIATAAVKLGIPVFKPLNEHSRADLILELGDQLMRVQCKWGRLSASRDVVIAVLRTSHYTPRGQVCRTYDEREIDLIGVYCGELDRSFLLPASRCACKQCIYLRLTPSRNRQQVCINLAEDFAFDGAVAQLARASRWQREGQGFESPQLHSPDPQSATATVSADACRDGFGSWIDRVAAGEDVIVTRRGKPMIRLTAAAPASAPVVVPPRVIAAAPPPAPAVTPRPAPAVAPPRAPQSGTAAVASLFPPAAANGSA